MTTIAQICEKWTMQLEPTGRDEWFVDYVLRSPKEAGIHLTAGWHCIKALREIYDPSAIRSAREYFGGIGAQALMINSTFAPEEHTVLEYSGQAVEHMKKSLDFETAPTVLERDSYDPSSCVPADLVALDFGDMTVWKTREGEPHRKLLDRVFAHRPKAVLITDIACRYLHLHAERYETLLGEGSCLSYDTYLAALAERLEGLYGYSLVVGYKHRWSTVMAFVPEVLIQSGEFHETPAAPLGIEFF